MKKKFLIKVWARIYLLVFTRFAFWSILWMSSIDLAIDFIKFP